MSSVFNELIKIDVSKHIEKKNKLTYLSWAWAWQYVKEKYPSANYKVVNFDGKPYLYDENLGYLVCTEVTIEGETIPMSLPVMDGANNAMKAQKYSYQVAEWKNRQKTGKMIDKWVEPATMFDINKTMMRCLVKNLAMFGLGHYIYAGEDLPVVTQVEMISEEDIAKLSEHIVNKGYTVEQICQSYGVKSLSEFESSMAKQVATQVNEWAKQAQQQG